MLYTSNINLIQILIVEDDDAQVFLLTEALSNTSYRYYHIDDGLEAYKFLANSTNLPDLVLLDYHLPNMDGLTLMQRLRDEGINCNFIFLTADYSIDTAVKSINSGALEFIPKDGRFVSNIPTIIKKAYNHVISKRDKEKYEQALKVSEQRFKLFMEATKDGIFEWNSTTGVSYCSDHNALILGFELINFPNSPLAFLRRVYEHDRKILISKIREHVINDTDLYEAEIRVKAADGNFKWLLQRGIVFDKWKGLTNLHIIGTHTDISERKLAEESLRQSEDEKKIILDNSHNAFILIDVNGQIVSYNKVADHRSIILTGQGLQKGKPAYLATPANDHQVFILNFEKALKGEPCFWEMAYNLRGNIWWYEYSMVAVMQSRNQIKYVCYTSTDITERREAEKRTMNAVIDAEERERKRFSEDLHDELGPLLSTIKIYINILHNEEIEPLRRQKLVDTTNELINNAIQTSKAIANNLSPSVIIKFGLISAIESFCQNILLSEKASIHFKPTLFNHNLKEEVEIIIYRIITELVNNSVKHSNGNIFCIEINSVDINDNTSDYHYINTIGNNQNRELLNKILQIKYTDNGSGFDFDKVLNTKNKGHGLQNIVTRIKSLNGNYYQIKGQQSFIFCIEFNV